MSIKSLETEAAPVAGKGAGVNFLGEIAEKRRRAAIRGDKPVRGVGNLG